jgi:hypothetical protein
MANINIYYHNQTNSWWINKDIDGFTLRNYIDENPVGLGTITMSTDNKEDIKDLYEISSSFIPSHIKTLSGITKEIEKNGLSNTIKVSDEELKELLNR